MPSRCWRAQPQLRCFRHFSAFLVIWLNANQYATGLALSLFGSGFSAFVGIGYSQESLTLASHRLFSHHYLVYGAVLLTAGLSWFLFRSKSGLVLRAVGESPEAAQALGYPVRSIRLLAVVVRRRAGRARRRVRFSRVHAAVGRGHDRGQGLDRARAHHLRYLAPGAGAARRVPVRLRDHAAAALCKAAASTCPSSCSLLCPTLPPSSCSF